MNTDQEQAAINRRQRIAEMMMAQGQEPMETNQMAGGYVVPISPLAGVAKVAQQLAGTYMSKQADKQQAEINRKKVASLVDATRGGNLDYAKLAESGADPASIAKIIVDRQNKEEEIRQRQAEKEYERTLPTTAQRDALYAAGGDETKARELLSNKIQNPLGMLNYQLQAGNVAADNARQEKQLGLQEQAAQRQYEQFLADQKKRERETAQNQTNVDLANWRLENPNYEKYQAQISDANSMLDKLNNSLDTYKEALKKYGQIDRHNPLVNTDLQTDYQAATWPLRDESMINTGVLNPGDKKALEEALTDPTSYGVKGFRSYDELVKQIDALKGIARSNVDAIIKSKSPKTPPPMKAGGTVNIDINNPENDQPEARAAIAADIAKDKEAGGPPVGHVDGLYKFKGGDPSDPRNWEPVK